MRPALIVVLLAMCALCFEIGSARGAASTASLDDSETAHSKRFAQAGTYDWKKRFVQPGTYDWKKRFVQPGTYDWKKRFVQPGTYDWKKRNEE
ncbi:hypothetical protein BOX15_Mlig017890g3 [Macrostomum lignano]|uniref:Uncharacterized protein n=1 Tax=Macrostomum lignano TaxID=282301 RepID=A0A267GBZ4_9PLAT|nr:hypothetical protein BOX15_Mlig017890g3 [Macrostomum lignano]